MQRAIAIFLLGLLAGGSAVLIYRNYAGADGGNAPADNGGAGTTKAGSGAESGRRTIVALGTLEPREGVTQISSPLVGYQIKKVLVQEGQLVKAGEPLVELDPSSVSTEYSLATDQQAEAVERQQLEISVAKQRLAAAELGLKQATDGRTLELEAQKSRISLAASKKKQAEKEVERLVELQKLAEPLTTELQVEQGRILVEAAEAECKAAATAQSRLEQVLTFQEQTAAAEVSGAKQSLTVAEKGTGLESLKRRVELADLKRQQAKILAPAPGMILGINTHPGEVVAQQPLLQLADLDSLVCIAEADASEAPNLQANQKASILCRAFRDAVLDGVVDRIGNQITKATLRPMDPRQKVDRDVIKVVVIVDAKKAAKLINSAGNDRRGALVGMQVEVSFPVAKQVP